MQNLLIWSENLKNIFTKEKIFEVSPAPIGNYLYGAIFFGILILAAVALQILAKRQSKTRQKVWGKIRSLLWFLGITGLVLMFFRWQSAPYLGSRFLMLILAGITLLWLAQIIWFKFVELPKEILLKKKKESFEKYLPRAKSRGLRRQT